jgi:transposase
VERTFAWLGHYRRLLIRWENRPEAYRAFFTLALLLICTRTCGIGLRNKGTKIRAVADRSGLPIALHIDRASPHEVTLVEDTLAATFIGDLPEQLIGDRAYDSDHLDEVLRDYGTEMIAPHRRGRRKTQDGRRLRRYRRRWKVERLFAWLFCWRRLVVRYEHHAENFLGLVQLACVLILLRRFG